ncbi:hypothetical protein B0H16DRAFT_1298763, partial [Mycena metata]
MRQCESNLNTINKIITYFARSNTDCTSLLSGTAVKAVISYVTDYISKLGLKSYQAFASVFDIFDRNAEDLDGIGVDEYSTKKLMRQMVNSMSTKMEIGSPMACMYLLENPDHYPSHEFANFAWRTYVNFVKRYWISQLNIPEGMKEEVPEDMIKLQNERGTLVGASIVDDYALRPLIYSGLNLYEWIQCHQKKELNNKTKAVKHLFIGDHKQRDTHGVWCDFSRLDNIIPNFMGGAIPRSDRGDREYYCMTVLTIFKSWRAPSDLKDKDSTWDQAFNEHVFTARQRELLGHFNLRFECNDARDDHYNTMKQKIREGQSNYSGKLPHNFADKDEEEDMNDLLDDNDLQEGVNDEDPPVIGKRTREQLKEMDEIRDILAGAKWLSKTTDGLLPMQTERINPPFKTKTAWMNIVKEQRKKLLANKLGGMEEADSGNDKTHVGKLDTVKELPFDYFKPKPKILGDENELMKAKCCQDFTLNTEQIRAFRIVADHVSSKQPTNLKMYLGGMGGSGKSQVIHAITAFFKMRGESHRFMILGPTGSTAALVNGSTYHSVFKV